MKEKQANHLVIFRTGKIWEYDIARSALKEHGIPFFAQTDSVSGVRTAVDVMPTMGPGVFWCVLVAETDVGRAREILRRCRLDVEKTPLIWDFHPRPAGKKFWKMYAWIIFIIFALIVLVRIASVLQR